MISTILLISVLNSSTLKVGVVFIAISAIIMGFVAKLKKIFNKNKKRLLVWWICTLVGFGLIALLSNEKVLNDVPLNSFIGFQVLFLIAGIIHFIALRKYFPNLSDKITNFFPEFLFTLVTALVGLIAFSAVVEMYKPEFKWIFLAAAICFVIPLLIVKLYEFAIAIPVPIFKQWLYPVDQKIADPTKEEMENPLVVSFEFAQKVDNENEVSTFRTKAPEKMEFGKLFYYFINEYNDKHLESTIDYLDENNNPYQWIFYTKPKWYQSRKHIDFVRTVQGNRIQEDDVIVCERVA